MRKIRISYSTNRHEVGEEREVGDEEAATLVREGRAVFTDVEDPAKANVANTKAKSEEPKADADAAPEEPGDAPAEAPQKPAKMTADSADSPEPDAAPAPGTGDAPAPVKASKSTRS